MTSVKPIHFALALLAACGAVRADEFGAMPGLWKTIYSLEAGKTGTAPPLRWHCVDEAADPWQAYAELDTSLHACKSATYERSLSALKWHMACGATPSEGSLVFDSPKHYSGTITTLGGKGAPRRTLHVEGERKAACTSPSD
ncbi:MAG: hypothetical protein JWR07_1869 [Nevskia sp.]|nr:hypothetical protein [Nevskia sp.]